MKWIAHRTEDGREQTVQEHLLGTAKLAEKFGEKFDSGREAYFSGMLHDAGKYSDAFQNHLLRDGPRCDHSTAGAKEALERRDLVAAFAVAGHHGGLPNGGCRADTADCPTLLGRRQKKIPDYNRFHREITPPEGCFPAWLGEGPRKLLKFQTAFYIRMIYSCLVDADFLDTEHFMTQNMVERGMRIPMKELLRRFDRFLTRKHWDKPVRELDSVRWDILRSCRDFGDLNPGLFTLTVPTGGGKTGASMAFALQHAVANGLSRIIYVIPYTSIIEQNAAVFREMLGEDCVLEHHSSAEFDTEDDCADSQTERKRLAAENWDASVIVTTAVQFFESLFAAKPSRCRKLHNIAGSVLIFDEAQMLPVPYLRPCVAAIAQLVEHYGCSAVLCTATQPALNPLFQEYASSLTVRELCPDAAELVPRFRRVTFRKEGVLSDETLAKKLNDERQVLCIVNSRKQAQSLYNRLDTDGRYHLSTLMTPEHRKRKLAEIRRLLREKRPCRVVSTSLIEAGVDVDFPTVYRSEAGLDSILQAAGRCNREAKNPPEKSVVHVFRPETGSPPLFRQNIAAADTALRQVGEPDSPEAIQAYFTALYQYRGDLDQKGIMAQWADGAQGIEYPFRVVADEFHLIEQQTTTVYIPTEKNEPLLAQLRQGEYSRELFRRLGQSAVAVYPQHLNALERGGYLEYTEGGARILRSQTLYSEETGLTMEPESGQAWFG